MISIIFLYGTGPTQWYLVSTVGTDAWCYITRESAATVLHTVYPKKYAHSFRFAVLCCGYTLTDFPISIRLTSLALWQSNDCPSASKATLMNMDKYFMWIHYERLHNHNKAKHNKTVCIFLGIYCMHPFVSSCCASYTRWKVKLAICRHQIHFQNSSKCSSLLNIPNHKLVLLLQNDYFI